MGAVLAAVLDNQDRDDDRAVVSVETPVEAAVRRELARELHDRVAQTLTTMLLELEIFRRDQYGRLSVQTAIDNFQAATSLVLSELRDLIYDLRAQEQTDHEFVDDVRKLLDDASSRYGVEMEFEVAASWPRALAAPAALQIRRIIQEAVHNARIHSGCSRISVGLRTDENGDAEVTIADDGRGVPQDVSDLGGVGIVGMRERAMLVRGRLTFETSPGRGTTVRLLTPPAAIAP